MIITIVTFGRMGQSQSVREIDAALEAFWASLESAHSRRGYRHDWTAYLLWIELEGLDVLKAKPSDIQRYITHMRDVNKAKKPTRARALSVIRANYGALVRDEILENNPAREVKNLKVDTAPKTPHLNEEAARKLYSILRAAATGDWRARRDRLLLLLFLGIGWRRSEVARMRVENFQHGEVTGIVKGAKTATAIVPAWLQKEIESWCTYAQLEKGPLLPRRPGHGLSISASSAYETVKTIAESAGLEAEEVTPHGLRRTLATISGDRGATLKDRQHALAHSSSHTTEKYDHAVGKLAPGELLADLVYGKREDEK